MGKIIKVRCNGKDKHINEIDVDALIAQTTIYRMWGPARQPQVRSRYVQPCKECSEGDVIVTREMIEGRVAGG